MGEHDGHRERLRRRFLSGGGQDMTDAELLELALCHCVPRRDVRPTAESLLGRFGSLSGVLDASAAELCEIAGIGGRSALLLGLLCSCRDAVRKGGYAGMRLSPGVLRELLTDRLRPLERDTLLAVYSDCEDAVLGITSMPAASKIDTAALCGVVTNQARFFRAPAVTLALGLVQAGVQPDWMLTLSLILRRKLEQSGIALLDFVVVSADGYSSAAGHLPRGSFPFRSRNDREAGL